MLVIPGVADDEIPPGGLTDEQVFGGQGTTPSPAPATLPTDIPKEGLTDEQVFGTGVIPKGGLTDEQAFGGGAQQQQPQRPSWGERALQNVEHGFSDSLAGVFSRAMAPYMTGVDQGMAPPTVAPTAESIAAARQAVIDQKKADDARYAAMPDAQGVWERSASVLGGLAGGGLSPENLIGGPEVGGVLSRVGEKVLPYIPFGKVISKTPEVVQRVIGAAAGQAPVAAAADVAGQGVKIATGEQDQYQPLETLTNAAFGAGVAGGLHAGGELYGALRGYIAKKRTVDTGAAVKPEDVTTATPDEFTGALADPDVQAVLKANGITSPTDPRAQQAADVLAKARAAQSAPIQPGAIPDRPASTIDSQKIERDASAPAQAGRQLDQQTNALRQERELVEQQATARADAMVAQGTLKPEDRDGFVQGIVASRMGDQPRPQPPPVIQQPAPSEGVPMAGTGAADTQQGINLRGGGQPTALVPTEQQPTRLTPDQLAARTAQNAATPNLNTAEPGVTLAGQEGRAPQTPTDVQAQREADQAFRLAQAQRQRAGATSADTQAGGRPEGVNAQPVHLDEGQPVKILKDEVITDAQGKTRHMATVQRFDPRTGQLDPEGVPYQVQMKDLKTGNYAPEPRQAQDFSTRAKSPAGEAQGLPEQTYRTTEGDPNEQFPGAGEEGRTPYPEQPPGSGPDKPFSDAEAAQRDFNERAQRGGETQYESRAKDQPTSNQPADLDENGAYPTDESGHVLSDKGGPIRFGTQKQAAKWIVKVGQVESKAGQHFEIVNHPKGEGFSVRERGRDQPGGPGAGAGEREAPRGETYTTEPDHENPGQHVAKDANGKVVAVGDTPAQAVQLAKIREQAHATEAGREQAGTRDEHQNRSEQLQGDGQDRGVEARDAEGRGEAGGGDSLRGETPQRGKGVKTPYVRVPKAPLRLTDFLRKIGGILDPDGEIRSAISGTSKTGSRVIAKGKDARIDKRGVRTPGGQDERNAIIAAHEAGYFPEHRDPRDMPSNDLYEAIRKDNAGEPVYSHFDHGDVRARQEAQQYNDGIDRLAAEHGIDPRGKSADEFFAEVRQKAGAREFDSANADEAHAADTAADAFEAGDALEPEPRYGEAHPEDEDIPFDSGPGRESENAGDQGASIRDLPESEHSTSGQDDVRESGGARDPGAGDGQREQDASGDVQAEATARGSDTAERNVDSTDAGEQRVIPGAERVSRDELNRRELERRAGQEKAQASEPQKPVGSDGGLFDSGHKQGSFTLGAFGDPDAIGRVITSALKGTGHIAAAAGKAVRDMLSDTKIAGAIRETARLMRRGSISEMGKAFAVTTDAHAAMISRYLRKAGHELAAKSVDTMTGLFRERPGTEGGYDYHTRVGQRANSRIASLYRALHEIMGKKGLTDEQNKQLRTALTRGAKMSEETPFGRTVNAIRKLLDDEHAYRRAVNKAIGFVKGYFPRMVDDEKVRANPEKFVAAAEKVYRINGSKDARGDAEAWKDRILSGDGELAGEAFQQTGVGHNSSKMREFGPEADRLLADFYKDDVPQLLEQYFRGSARETEGLRIKPTLDAARKTLANELGKLPKEQAGDILSHMDSMVDAHLGRFGSNTSRFARSAADKLQLLTFLGALKHHLVTGIAEPFIAPFRAGINKRSLGAVADSFRQMYRYMRSKADEDDIYGRHLAESAGVLTDASQHALMNTQYNLENGGNYLQRKATEFMHSTLMEQLMVGKRIAFAKLAHGFMVDNVLDAVTKTGNAAKRATFYLKELGIDDPAAFKKWLIDERDGRVSSSELDNSNDPRVQQYLLAINKFVSTVVMTPTAATKPVWASHPFWRSGNTLNAYVQAFGSNVVNRNIRMVKKAMTEKDLNYALPTIAWTLPYLSVVAGLEYGVRPLLQSGDTKQTLAEQSPSDQALRVMDRSGGLGGLSPYVNAVEGVRYRRPLFETLGGPSFGRPVGALQKILEGWQSTSKATGERTRSGTREIAEGIYDLIIDPAVTLAMMHLPGGNLVKGAAIMGAGDRIRSGFVNTFGGEKEAR